MHCRFFFITAVVCIWSAWLSAAPYLSPGPGWSGATAQPAQIGSGTASDKYAIAHWDAVPYVTFADTLNVGVLAYHFNDIDSVTFSVNKGPWQAVTQTRLNPETNAEEYWVTLDAAQFAKDTLVEVRAIAYPKIGMPKVLSALFLNANSRGTLPHAIRYVSATGHDSNNGQTPAQACSSIAGAIAKAGTGGNVDGVEIRLGEGNWRLPSLANGWQQAYRNSNQWLTITSAPDIDSTRVLITGIDGPGDGAGMWLKLLRLHNLSIIGPIDKAPGGNFEDYLWADHVRIYSTDPTSIATGNTWRLQGYAQFSGVYITDCYMNNMGEGPRNATLARNVFADTTGAGHASGTTTVVNYSLRQVYGSGYPFPGGPGPDYHGDAYQFYGNYGDVIIDGVRFLPGGFLGLRGIVGGNNAISDVAIVNVDLEPSGMWVFSFCDPIDHMVIKNSRFTGASDWCAEGGRTANPAALKNILIDHSVFNNGSAQKVPQPWNLPGIRYVPALGTAATAPAMPINFKAKGISSSQIELTWNDVINESGYHLERSADGASDWTQIATPAANMGMAADNGPAPNTTYYYRLRAWNAVGDGTWSATVSATTPGVGMHRQFGPSAVIPAGNAAFTVYNARGRVVMIGNGAGAYKKLSRGVYFIRTRAGMRKLLVLD